MTTGFLAQQLFEIFPDAVSEGGEDADIDPWMVDYGRLTPLLVKAIQDQQKEIDQLKKENEEFKSRINSIDQIENLVAEIKNQIETKDSHSTQSKTSED